MNTNTNMNMNMNMNMNTNTNTNMNMNMNTNTELETILSNCGYNNAEILNVYDSDDHGFKFKPTKFRLRDSSEYVIKPRTSLLDIAVLKLFNDINKVNANTPLNLPYYNIVNCGKYSIWDYIEGDENIDATDPSISITTIIPGKTLWTPKTKINHKRKNNLEYLNTVASLIGLTDLHGENIILKNDIYYPIDLEAIDTNITGLYGFNEKGPVNIELLNKESLDLIEKFNYTKHVYPNRYLPISTNDFQKYLNDDNMSLKTILETFYTQTKLLKKKKLLKKNINKQKLTNYLLECKQNKIIPYFILKNSKIFYYNFNIHKYTNLLKYSINCKQYNKKKSKCKSKKKCKYNKKTKKCRKI